MKYSPLIIGILSYHGDVIEHINTTNNALTKLKIKGLIKEVRTSQDLNGLSGLIIPGGESTVMHKLSIRNNIFEKIKKVPYIFGTCAGAIMLAKKIHHSAQDQKSFNLMDITIDRNSYGKQSDSFSTELICPIGKLKGIFIRAPRILSTGRKVKTLITFNGDIVACEEKVGYRYYLATCFHPELTTTIFHEYFIQKIIA